MVAMGNVTRMETTLFKATPFKPHTVNMQRFAKNKFHLIQRYGAISTWHLRSFKSTRSCIPGTWFATGHLEFIQCLSSGGPLSSGALIPATAPTAPAADPAASSSSNALPAEPSAKRQKREAGRGPLRLS
jgi:hypothetical protein